MSIHIIERPKDVTYHEVCELISLAHREIVETKGIVMRAAFLDGDKLKERIGENGVTFVALDEGKLVGTLSIREKECNAWYTHGKVAELVSVATHPEYRGKHVFSMLYATAWHYVENKEYKLLELDTAANNTNAINVYKHCGFVLVDFKAPRDADHYSVVMAKWRENAPFNRRYCSIMYRIRKMMVKFRYRVGRKKRFGI